MSVSDTFATAAPVTPMPPTAPPNPVRLAQLALLLAFCFDWLFVGQMLGMSVLVFVSLIVGVLLWSGWRAGRRPRRSSWLLLLGLLFFAGMAAVRSNGFLLFLNLGAALLLLVLFAHYFERRGVAEMGLQSLLLLPLFFGLQALARAGAPIRAALAALPGRSRGWRAFLPVLRGIFLAAPILFGLTLLLGAADMVFADLVTVTIWEWAVPTLLSWSWRGFLVAGVCWCLAGLFAQSALRPDVPAASDDLAPQWTLIKAWYRLGWIEAATIMALVNGLLGLFVWVQFTYFFGGRENIDLNGFTYAEYARRGFFEIVLAACLAAALILGLNALTERAHKREIRLFNGLSTILIVLIIIMLVSAFNRMSLYEMAYGFTRLRIYSHVFMIWLGVVLLWLAGTLWRRPEWFAVGLWVGALGFVATLNVMNVDAFIAQQNVNRWLATGDSSFLNPNGSTGPAVSTGRTSLRLDTGYLRRLSDDAVPVLVATLPHMPDDIRADVEADLTIRWERYENSRQWRRWPAFHLGRYRAQQALSAWAGAG